MTRYFNIDRYEREKYGLISIYILLLDTNTSAYLVMRVGKRGVPESERGYIGNLPIYTFLVLPVSITSQYLSIEAFSVEEHDDTLQRAS